MQAILKTTEQAAKSFVESLPITASVFTGIDNEEKDAPCVIICCDSATEEFIKSGVFFVKTRVICKEMAADTNTTSSFSKTVFDGFMQPTIENNLMAQTSSYTVCLVNVDDAENRQEGDAWIQQMTFEIICGT